MSTCSSPTRVTIQCRPAPGHEDWVPKAVAGLIASTRFCFAVVKDTRRGEHSQRVEYALRNLDRHRPEVADEIVALVERVHLDGDQELNSKCDLILGPSGIEVVDDSTIHIADGNGYAELKVSLGQPSARSLGDGLRRLARRTDGTYSVQSFGEYKPPRHAALVSAVVAQVNADRAGEPGPLSEAVAESPHHRHVCEVRCRNAWPASVHWTRHDADDGVDYTYRCDPRCYAEENCTQEEIRNCLRMLRIPLCTECLAPLRATGLDDDEGPLGWVCDTPDHLCSVGGQTQRVEPGVWGFEQRGS